MKKHVRTITIVAVALLLPMLLILPITQAKRAKKSPSKPALTQPNDTKNATLLPRSLMTAQHDKGGPTPIVSSAVRFAATIPLRDMEVPTSTTSRKFGQVETNTETPEKITRRSAMVEGDYDATLGESARSAPETQPDLLTTPQANFEGLNNEDNQTVLGFPVNPPDTVGDVGPNHYVQAINLLFSVYDKTGTKLTPERPISALFTAMGGRCANIDDGDPIVLYDSFADRWIVTQFLVEGAIPFGQCFAISQTGDPTGAYFTYDFVYPVNKFNDYPKFGVWPDGYYFTANQFNLALTAFLGVGVGAFDREKVLRGDPTAGQIFFDLETTFPFAASVLPSDADGLVPPPASAPNIMSYFAANEFGDPEGDALVFFAFDANFANPMASTFTPQGFVPVAAFNPITPIGRDDIEQPAPATATAALDAIGDRLMHRLQYRRIGNEEVLTSNHTVNAGTPGMPPTQAQYRAGVRWYELRRTTGNTGLFAIRNQQTFAPGTDTHERWMASAATDNEGNLALGYSIVDGSVATPIFPGIRYTGRTVGAPLNTLDQLEETLQVGSGVQTNNNSRWGDYSAMNVDPNDDCTFFYTQMYYQTTDPTPADAPFGVNWQTGVGSFRFTECTAPQQGTLQVNVTNCATGLPAQGAAITIDGNLYDTTGAAGQSVTQLPPGAYTVTISGPNIFPVTINNVVITNGNTTIINQCLAGSPNIAAAGATITAESCSPANNALDPGETVTVNFGLKNNGVGPTVNLVATLQATGGVTSPSGPQNYGAIPADNTTVVTRPFTFAVDPSVDCGDTVTATLQLQDGANDLGTVTFTFQVGVVGGVAPPATYSSGNIAVPILDNTTVDVPINVGDLGTVTDVNVRVRLNHTFDGDLEIRLIHPDGTTVLLSDNRGGAGQNFGTDANDCSGTPTVFDDEATTAISAGAAPFAGSFKPETVLSALDGKPTNGTWKLRVTDPFNLDEGVIGCVTLEITRRRFVCCGVPGAPQIDAGPATIVNESCPPANDAIDPGERVTVNLSLTNNGDAATNNLVATLVQGGGVTAPSHPQSYGAMPPVPFPGSTATRDFTFTAVGSCGTTLTATWLLNDRRSNLGTVTKTFQLGATVNTTTPFSNPAPITILDTPRVGGIAPATPYPSTINVAGLTNPVTGVTVTLKNLSHTFPSDIDILLVGPGGQKMMLMSDVGGGTSAVNATLTFDDAAATGIGATVVTGTFKPTNLGAGDLFPPPAPAGPHSDPQLLSLFNGVNPNGTWSLYVVDDFGLDAGIINGGWELNITTSTVVCTTPCGMVRLVISSTPPICSGRFVKVSFRAQNTGTPDAVNTMLTTAMLGTTNGGPLPVNMGTVFANNFSPFFNVFFTNPTPGSSTLKLGGTFNSGTFSSNKRVTVPACGMSAPFQ